MSYVVLITHKRKPQVLWNKKFKSKKTAKEWVSKWKGLKGKAKVVKY